MKGIKNRLRVTHLPQLGVAISFSVPVNNEREAFLVQQTLANQHICLLENNIIEDYSNIVMVEMFCTEEKDWVDYYDYEQHMDWDEVYSILETPEDEKLDIDKTP